MRQRILHYALLCLIAPAAFVGCTRRASEPLPALPQAEALIYTHPDSALRLLERLSSSAARAGREDRATWCLLMTHALYKNYRPIADDSLLNIAADYFLRRNDPHRKAEVLYLKGILHDTWNRKEEAIRYFLQALEYHPQIPDDYRLLQRIYTGIANIYLYRDNGQQAELYLQEAYRIAELSGDKEYMANILALYARCHSIQKDWENAASRYEEAIAIVRELGDTLFICNYSAELSTIYLRMKEYDLALEAAKTAFDLGRKYPIFGNHLYLHLGDAYMATQQTDSAVYYLERAAETDNIHAQRTAYNSLYQLYQTKSDYPAALRAMQQLLSRTDSIHNMQRRQAIEQIAAQYNVEKVVNEKNQVQMKKDGVIVVILSGSLVTICILGLLLYLFWRRSRRKEQALQKQEKQLKEYLARIRTNDMLIRQNEAQIESLLANHQSSLQQQAMTESSLRQLRAETAKLRQREYRLYTELIPEGHVLHNVLTASKPRPIKENEWIEIIKIVDRLYHGFTSGLSHRMNLTSQEIHICCLIKLNQSVARMADLLSINAPSVSREKLRIKEKLKAVLGDVFEEKTLDSWIQES
ncbi:MAG: tetratricopeptide repeat protein [Prevotellaceae bacterium]|jgi:tetratricopeptide (TPR) repeat protein|nr:tetratricopeptide repeat protein [Prevotellaceae bacterium]